MTTTFADRLIDEGFRRTEFLLDQNYGRTCQLHTHKWSACFRPISGPYHSISQYYVPVDRAVRSGDQFFFDERLRYLQWEKRTGVMGSLLEASIALAYSMTSRHQTGVIIQTWLNPSPTLQALSSLDFDVPFTVLWVDGMSSEVSINWYGSNWILELSAFSFCDLLRFSGSAS